MDWMYDGIQIQKEDYLLGKKVDKKFGESTNNDKILPPQICPPNNTFCQVDLTKKIIEDPLVTIKKREIECTQKILQNPMRLKKQQNIQKEKHKIEDHKLDMIIVSRLKSFQKAGLDLREILSITKHKGKKDQKNKCKTVKSSSEEVEKSENDEKSVNRQNRHAPKSNSFERGDKRQNDKKSFEYSDHKRNGNKNRSERHLSVSSSNDTDSSKKNKFANEYIDQRNSSQKYKSSHSKRNSVGSDRDNNHQSFIKKRNERQRTSKEKHDYQNYRNSKIKYSNNQHIEKDDNRKYEKPKYKQEEDKNRDKRHNDNKIYKSLSSVREPDRKKQNDIPEHSTCKSKSNEQHNRLNNSVREHESKGSIDSRNRHGCYKSPSNRRSRSESPQKGKKYQRTNTIKKNNHRYKSYSSSSSDDERKNKSTVKQNSKRPHGAESQSDNEKHIQHDKDDHKGRKDYGLFVPKGHNLKKSSLSPQYVKIQKNTSSVRPEPPPVKKKNLTKEEMEKMRKEMMKDAKIRDKERFSNVKRYRNEDKKEKEKQKPYSKEFLIKQLAHAASQVSVERSIKSNINKLQKNNSIAD